MQVRLDLDPSLANPTNPCLLSIASPRQTQDLQDCEFALIFPPVPLILTNSLKSLFVNRVPRQKPSKLYLENCFKKSSGTSKDPLKKLKGLQLKISHKVIMVRT